MNELLTGALVLVTTFYAWATFKILRANEQVVTQMQRQIEQISRPYITVSLNVKRNIIRLLIANTGQTVAKNVRLTLDKDFHQFGDTRRGNLRSFIAFTETIQSLAPNQALEFYLGTGPGIYGSKAHRELAPLTFKVTAQYSFDGKEIIEETPVDLRPLVNTALDEDEQTQALKDINKTLERLARKG